MFHPALPIGSKEVEAQAVSMGIDQSHEPSPEGDPKRGFKQALEDRKLNALAVIFAELGDLAQASTPSLGLCLDVVCYQHHHLGYLQKNDG
jgi:hypothetical protein